MTHLLCAVSARTRDGATVSGDRVPGEFASHGLKMFVRPFRGRDAAMTVTRKQVPGQAVTDYLQTLIREPKAIA
jgi:hypothetical protein